MWITLRDSASLGSGSMRTWKLTISESHPCSAWLTYGLFKPRSSSQCFLEEYTTGKVGRIHSGASLNFPEKNDTLIQFHPPMPRGHPMPAFFMGLGSDSWKACKQWFWNPSSSALLTGETLSSDQWHLCRHHSKKAEGWLEGWSLELVAMLYFYFDWIHYNPFKLKYV